MNIADAMNRFIENISLNRSENTAKTYRNGLNAFSEMLEEMDIDPSAEISILTEDFTAKYAKYLKSYSSATETLYINVFKNFLEYLTAENLLSINLHQVKLLISQRTRKPGIRLPQFPIHDIEKMIVFASALPDVPVQNETDRLINYRDAAFLITLADTGLRIHEICALRRGDIDWFGQKALIIGKGNKQAVIRFSDRSVMAMRNYLELRGIKDGSGSMQLSSYPIFARHDKGAGDKVLPITTKTGRLIVSNRVAQCLGNEAAGTITPHSFRHYFVTTVLHETGNLKIAQEFARHTNIAVTQRYSHLSNEELDDTYGQIFNK